MFDKMITGNTENGIERLREALESAECVMIGAGAGLSTSAGFIYNGRRFLQYFGDFADKYHFQDMYTGGFYPYPTLEENWAYWSRYIYINRYMKAPKPVYNDLFSKVREKDYFVLTTNVDHQFQKAGFDKERMFYTQGDYGLWQCSKPCHRFTYKNKDKVVRMVLSQGFRIGENGGLEPPVDDIGITDYSKLSMRIPSDLVPYCPVCGEPMSMNLRADDTFVEDTGWEAAANRYVDFTNSRRESKTLFLELGIGWNTPGIVKFNFWRMTNEWPSATYACLNFGEAMAPEEIRDKAILLNGDIGEILQQL